MANTYDVSGAISDSVTQYQSMFPNLARLGEVQASEILKSIANSQSYKSLDDFMGTLFTKRYSLKRLKRIKAEKR